MWIGWMGCTGASSDDKPKDNGDGQVDADADTDTDADSDTDTDTDTDADTDLPSTFEAEILYQETLDGSIHCSTELSLVGTSYTGLCPNCDFAFEAATTIASQNDPECHLVPYYSWTEDDRYVSPKIAFSSTFVDYVPLSRTFHNVLWFSSYLDLPDYYYYYTTTGSGLVGPIWYMMASDEDPNSNATFDGTNLEWSFDITNPYYNLYTDYLDYCGPADYNVGVSSPFANPAYAGELTCDSPTIDVWEFEAQAGDELRISVDSLVTATLMVTTLQLTDDTGCILATTGGSFPCSGDYGLYFPYNYCPAMRFTAPNTGTYRAVVTAGGYSTCPTSGVGEYQLVVASPAGPATLIADEEPRYTGPYEYELSVRMFGTVGE
jgi:hypothetical protein